MNKKKQQPRAHVAMNMISDLFLNSVTRFNPLAKLPKLNEVEQRLKHRVQQAVKSKSPDDRKISVTKASDLGPGNLWKGLDLLPQRNAKSPGNQQRLQTLANQSSLTPQKRIYQTLQNNPKNQKEVQTHINQNSPKKPIQRHHNRGQQNNLNDSRYHGQTRQVTGNIVSQNLVKNHKSIRDDFGINDKSGDKKRKYSNENDKSLNVQSSTKILNRNMTQSRAVYENKDKRVSFSPQKPKQHTIQKKQPVAIKKNIDVKPIQVPSSKLVNKKQQTYVYVPPKKRLQTASQENAQQNSQSLNPPIQPLQTRQKSGSSAIQETIESKKVIIQSQNKSLQKRAQISPKKVGFNLSNKPEPTIQTPKPTRNVKINSTVIVEQTIEIRKQTIIKTPRPNIKQSNVSLDMSSKSKSPQKVMSTTNLPERKKTDVSVEEMRNDWSKIKQNLKYDGSLSPSNTNAKKVPERQDVALKMIAQLFLDASTRYFPGLSMLLRRGISKQQIERIRSKSSEFKINVLSIEKKSPSKPQPKTDRKLNWKDSDVDKSKKKQNNRMYQGDVTATQYRMKNLEQVAETSGVDQSGVSRSQAQEKQKGQNIVTANLQKNNKKVTRDDLVIDQHKKSPSSRSNSIRESPDVYNRQNSKKDVEESKKDLAKMKSQAGNKQSSNFNYSSTKKQQAYVYQPPAKKNDQKIEEPISSKQSIKIQEKPTSSKQINVSKSQTSITLPTTKANTKIVVKQELKKQQPKTSIATSKTSVNSGSGYVYQPSSKKDLNANSSGNIALKKPQTKQIVSKEDLPKQLAQSKSQTNMIQNQKPLASQPVKPSLMEQKKNVNYGQNTPKNSEIKPNLKLSVTKLQEKKTDITPKNISIFSSKSQTSLVQTTQQAKKTPIQPIKQHLASSQAYHPQNRKDTSLASSYVYQPPNSFNKKDNLGTQQNLPSKNQNSQTLKSVQSQKLIRTSDTTVKTKAPQTLAMIKKDHKTVTGIVELSKPNQPTTKQLQTKQVSLLSKRFSTMIFLVLKRRLNQNYKHSLEKIQNQAKSQSQSKKQVSLLNRTLTTFSHKYETILKRTAFKIVKNFIVIEVNKIIKENNPEKENNSFSSGRKESATRIIFWLIKNQLKSIFQPFRQLYLSHQNKGKTKQSVIQAMARVFQKRYIIFKKDSFKAIKLYKNQRQAVLQNFATALNKIKYEAVSQHFSTFVSKDIKQLGADVQKLKQKLQSSKQIPSSESQKILSKSKSQEVISSSKSINYETQVTNETLKLSPADEAKLESKRKQVDRKIADMQRKKDPLQSQFNDLNKDKRAKTKKNAELKVKLKELQKQMQSQDANAPIDKAKTRQNCLTQEELIPILTRIYAYLFEDADNNQIVVERFLSDNQHCFQLPTNPALLNEWKVINKNAQLKKLIKLYEGEQPRQKKIAQVLQQQNSLMGKLMRSFVRERYIWEWVNIIAHQ